MREEDDDIDDDNSENDIVRQGREETLPLTAPVVVSITRYHNARTLCGTCQSTSTSTSTSQDNPWFRVRSLTVGLNRNSVSSEFLNLGNGSIGRLLRAITDVVDNDLLSGLSKIQCDRLSQSAR